MNQEIEYCPCCHQKISLRRKRIDKAMVSALLRAFTFVSKRGNGLEFKISEIDFTAVEYGVLNHLVRFGLLYKNETMERGTYGMPYKRVYQFLRGDWLVSEFYETNPTKKEGEIGRRVMSESKISIRMVPSYKELKEEFGPGITEYLHNPIQEGLKNI